MMPALPLFQGGRQSGDDDESRGDQTNKMGGKVLDMRMRDDSTMDAGDTDDVDVFCVEFPTKGVLDFGGRRGVGTKEVNGAGIRQGCVTGEGVPEGLCPRGHVDFSG